MHSESNSTVAFAGAREKLVPIKADCRRLRGDDLLFILALLYAVAVSPFIGGVRGFVCMIGWLIVPIVWIWRTRSWEGVGLRSMAIKRSQAGVLLASIATGLCTAAILRVLSIQVPVLTGFVAALPYLHRGFVGNNIPLFIAMIPVGHFVHELFYRGYLQSRFTERLNSFAPAIILSALLYAWTHVFIFSSREFQLAMAAVYGPGGLGTADVQRTITAVVSYSFIESTLAGVALRLTGSIWPGILIRWSLLTAVCMIVYTRTGLL